MGADAGTDEIARQFAATYGCTVAITGPEDVISDGKQVAWVRNGDVMLSRVVGTGCMSDVIVAAFAAVQSDPFTAAVGGLVAFGAAGELAAKVSGNQPGTFAVELLNGLYALDPTAIRAMAKVTLAEA